jgi:hypothetical protein
VAGIDHMLRKGAAFYQPDEEEEAVDPHRCVIANGAKRSSCGWLDCFVAALLAMTYGHFFLSLASSAKAWDDGAR